MNGDVVRIEDAPWVFAIGVVVGLLLAAALLAAFEMRAPDKDRPTKLTTAALSLLGIALVVDVVVAVLA